MRENIMSHKGNASLYGAALCVNGIYQLCMNIKANHVWRTTRKSSDNYLSKYIGMFRPIEVLNKLNIPDSKIYVQDKSNFCFWNT